MTNDPTITLAGREWPIPLLAMRQNRVVVPALMKVMPTVARLALATESNDFAMMLSSLSLTTEEFDLIADAVHAAITRGTPGFARAEFDELPISVAELFGALPVVMSQTGMMKAAEGPNMGEATAGKSIGTA